VVGKDDGAGTGLGWGRLDLVGGLNVLGLIGFLQSRLEVVVTD
jgi:hypothetical protein